MKTKLPKTHILEESGDVLHFLDNDGKVCDKGNAVLAIVSFDSDNGPISYPVGKSIVKSLDLDVGDKINRKIIHNTFRPVKKRPHHKKDDIPEDLLKELKEERREFEEWFAKKFNGYDNDFGISKYIYEDKDYYLYTSVYVQISWETWQELK
jgi:hypothetical protein